MTGYTFKPSGFPSDNGLVRRIAAKQRAEQALERARADHEQGRVAEKAKKAREYKTRGGVMVLHDPLAELLRRKKRNNKKRR